MIRTTDPLAFRTLKPLYEHRQGTAFGPVFLNTSFSLSGGDYIYPGMVAAGPVADNPLRVKVATDSDDTFFGLFTHNCNTQIDELNSGALRTSVWYGIGSCWRIFQPAYDTDATWAVPSDGTSELLTWTSVGKLTPSGVNGNPAGSYNCAKLISVSPNGNYIDVQLVEASAVA